MQQPLTCVEICAGAGGQALGLAMAGFVHVALVEYEADYCKVLKENRPEWNIICADVHDFDGRPYRGVDLLAGGVPCPPFSVAGKQLGKDDERDLFPEAIGLSAKLNQELSCWKMCVGSWTLDLMNTGSISSLKSKNLAMSPTLNCLMRPILEFRSCGQEL